MDKLQTYTKTYTTTTNYYDKFEDLTPMAILDLFQNLAGRHAYLLNAGFNHMASLGAIWVIARNEVQIRKQVAFASDLTIKTWPLIPTRFYFDRIYELSDLSGDLCIVARSRWLLVDINNRRMLPSNVYKYPLTSFNNANYFSDDFPRLEQVERSEQKVLSHTVRNSEIDTNGHFNNARYAELIYNALNVENKNSIASFLIYYLSECRLGDTIDLYVKNKDNIYQVSGYLNEIVVFNSKIVKR